MSEPQSPAIGAAPAAAVEGHSGQAHEGRQPYPEEQANWVSRLVWFVLFTGPTAVIITAMTLTPNPIGHSTHTQLGLPACGFLEMSGFPCPGCGLTTAFSNMVRGNVVAAAMANPFGVPLFMVTAIGAVIALIALVRGWPVIATLDRFRFERVMVTLAVCSLLVWCVKIATMLAA